MAFFKDFFGFRRSYFDYASSTPLDQRFLASVPRIDNRVLAANPSALHKEGVALKRVLRDARMRVARVLGAHDDEIIFTSNATESDNIAIQGTVAAYMQKGCQPEDIVVMGSALEHAAVSETIQSLMVRGIRTVTIPAEHGVVDPAHILIPNGAKVVIVSVMFVQNEIGTVQPIKAIAKRIRFLRKHNPEVHIVFHIDATQAPLYYDLNTSKLGIDMMTLGATKLYCNKGVGLLFIKRGTPVAGVLFGGGQEFGLRPGTEPVALIHEFSYALVFAQQQYIQAMLNTRAMQQYFEVLLEAQLPQMHITASTHERAPHITHIACKGIESELLVIELDARGIAVSAKSACKNEDADESSLVVALYGAGYGAVRFSFGRYTSKHDVKKAINALVAITKKYRI